MRRGPRDGGQRSSKFIVAARPPQRQRESYPIQDEPEAGVKQVRGQQIVWEIRDLFFFKALAREL